MDEQADFVAKLRQIEEVALAAAADIKEGLARPHFRHIALIARTLRGRLELGVATVRATMAKPASDSPDEKPPA
jgi:hypothetical protein